eukprot:TRINITY_DN51053_c0_g1_i1.p1 TRINITY_DN51053_c0_g1~~TRINITY_DN51053_c0_g1_i1.p1  ORF type:complete len:378 (+),score=43.12 TRINITY_DN51053_c0_g1_i1:142-1275(+)
MDRAHTPTGFPMSPAAYAQPPKQNQCIWGSLLSEETCTNVSYGVAFIGGTAILSTFALAELKLSDILAIRWLTVLAPVAVTLAAFILALTVTILVAIYFSIQLTRVGVDVDASRLSIEALIRAAKVCMLTHAYLLMLNVAMWLFLLKLRWLEDQPPRDMALAYPLLPVMLLGTFHIIAAMVFTAPDVDVWSSVFMGLVLLGQSMVMVVKIDNTVSFQIPWVLAFVPSWLAYVLVLLLCLRVALVETEPPDYMDAGVVSVNTFRRRVASSRLKTTHEDPTAVAQSSMVTTILAFGTWTIGCCTSQALLALRLDDFTRLVPWGVVLLPAIVAWTILMLVKGGDVVDCLCGMAEVVIFPFRALSVTGDALETDPLLLPWR